MLKTRLNSAVPAHILTSNGHGLAVIIWNGCCNCFQKVNSHRPNLTFGASVDDLIRILEFLLKFR